MSIRGGPQPQQAPELAVCCWCGLPGDPQVPGGLAALLTTQVGPGPNRTLAFHEACAAYGAVMVCGGSSGHSCIPLDGKTITRRLLHAEWVRSRRLTCVLCGKTGASVQCMHSSECRKAYHLPCARRVAQAGRDVVFAAAGRRVACRKHAGSGGSGSEAMEWEQESGTQQLPLASEAATAAAAAALPPEPPAPAAAAAAAAAALLPEPPAPAAVTAAAAAALLPDPPAVAPGGRAMHAEAAGLLGPQHDAGEDVIDLVSSDDEEEEEEAAGPQRTQSAQQASEQQQQEDAALAAYSEAPTEAAAAVSRVTAADKAAAADEEEDDEQQQQHQQQQQAEIEAAASEEAACEGPAATAAADEEREEEKEADKREQLQQPPPPQQPAAPERRITRLLAQRQQPQQDRSAAGQLSAEQAQPPSSGGLPAVPSGSGSGGPASAAHAAGSGSAGGQASGAQACPWRLQGHQWQLSGDIGGPPPHGPEDIVVLSTVIPQRRQFEAVTRAYEERMRANPKDCPPVVVSKTGWLTRKEQRDKVGSAIQAYIEGHLGAELTSAAQLPAVLPVADCGEVFSIPPDDPRRGLASQPGALGWRNKASAGRTRKFTVLGSYQALQLKGHHYEDMMEDFELAEHMDLSRPEMRLRLQMYGADADLRCFLDKGSPIPAAKPLFEECGLRGNARKTFVFSAFGYGNEMALVNDVAGDPIGDQRAGLEEPTLLREPNCAFVLCLIFGWPFLFLVTTDVVEAGEEFVMTYGGEYWHLVRCELGAQPHASRQVQSSKQQGEEEEVQGLQQAQQPQQAEHAEQQEEAEEAEEAADAEQAGQAEQAEQGPQQATPVPAGDIMADVCILGAGIIGLCSALVLLRADPALRVVLVDRKLPCSGATGAGQGYLWLAHRDVHSPLFTMAAQSRELWSQLLASAVPQLTADALEWQPIGSLLIASTTEESEALVQRRRLLTNAGLRDAHLLTAAEARRLEPALELSSEGAALLVPSDVQVNGRSTAAALLHACEAHDKRFTALFNEGARKLLQGDSGRVLGVQTEGRRVHAGRGVVVTLGAWSGAFLADQMADVRWAAAFRPRRGLLLEMPRPGSMPPVQHGMMELGYTQHYSQAGSAGAFTAYQTAQPGAAAGGGAAAAAGGATVAAAEAGSGKQGEGVDITFTATTSKSGSLLVGSSREFAGFGSDAPEAVVQAIMQRAHTFLPGLATVQRPDIHVRCGPRPYATAGSPIVDTVPGADGVVVAAGHEGSGLTLAPATAALVADLLLGQPCGLDAEVIQAARAGDPNGDAGGGGNPVRRSPNQEPIISLYGGRFYPGRNGTGLWGAKLPQLMTWAGCSVTVRFTGSAEVSVELDGRMTSVPVADRWVDKARSDLPSVVFEIELDGEMSTVQVTKGTPLLTWNETGLTTWGWHILTITRVTEPRYGAVWLRDINLDASGKFLQPAIPPHINVNRRMLFIGDSYTAGAGNTGDKSCKNANAANSNNLLAYGPLAADAFKADYQVLGWSVATLNIYREVAGDTWSPALRRAFWPKVKDFWKRADALDPSSQFNMLSWVPQVIVMAAGTNDFANTSISDGHKVESGVLAKLPSMDDWVDEHVAFVKEIARTYPQAIIINLVFPLEQQLVGVRTLEQTLAYLQYLAASMARFQALRMKNVYTLQLDGSQFPNTNCCSPTSPSKVGAAQLPKDGGEGVSSDKVPAGSTALTLACALSKAGAVQALLDAGAGYELPTLSGSTWGDLFAGGAASPWHWAAERSTRARHHGPADQAAAAAAVRASLLQSVLQRTAAGTLAPQSEQLMALLFAAAMAPSCPHPLSSLSALAGAADTLTAAQRRRLISLIVEKGDGAAVDALQASPLRQQPLDPNGKLLDSIARSRDAAVLPVARALLQHGTRINLSAVNEVIHQRMNAPLLELMLGSGLPLPAVPRGSGQQSVAMWDGEYGTPEQFHDVTCPLYSLFRRDCHYLMKTPQELRVRMRQALLRAGYRPTVYNSIELQVLDKRGERYEPRCLPNFHTMRDWGRKGLARDGTERICSFAGSHPKQDKLLTGGNRLLWMLVEGEPWSPADHRYWPPAFKAAARTLLLAHRRGAPVKRRSRASSSSSAAAPTPLSHLPHGFVLAVLAAAAFPLEAWFDEASITDWLAAEFWRQVNWGF
ncbi:glycine oxidase isoform X1 isoform A [Chlorella sorokiniana]|uniref:FAD-dependent oxidoreductase domain-containing protein 1 n=1 Tax=Chlorella sorokiniana TaxID=3076 RepID=A0A2P6TLD8_CHLSO|nr:glycine oxidase isoform X1 isoform A [Chlorella sorokiniana]|eukprot:PRW45110.1 glycine oxidase isoform X1 isoform A [Chlorella sorokiniana]